MRSRTPYPTLQRFIASGGTIDVGRLDVLECAAVASDSETLWVALSRRAGESIGELLERLDETLLECLTQHRQVDEIAGLVAAANARQNPKVCCGG
jgi:hypothetical protein